MSLVTSIKELAAAACNGSGDALPFYFPSSVHAFVPAFLLRRVCAEAVGEEEKVGGILLIQ